MHKMLVDHDPENGRWGDCHRTAIAALLGLHPSEVPHFYRAGPARPSEETEAEINCWLGEQFQLRQVHVPYPGQTPLDEVLTTVSSINPGLSFLLGGTSRTGCGHTVVCRHGRIDFDPSPKDSGIIGPMEDGHWWITFLGRAL